MVVLPFLLLILNINYVFLCSPYCQSKAYIRRVGIQKLQYTDLHSILLYCHLKSHAAASALKNFNIRHYKKLLIFLTTTF